MNKLKTVLYQYNDYLDDYMFTQHNDTIFTFDGCIKIFFSSLGIRMTIIRLNNNKLVIFDPVSINKTMQEFIATLGQVEYILAPNNFHYLYISECSAIYPQATVLVSPGLPKRIKSMRQFDIISKESMSNLNDDLSWLLFDAIPTLSEVVILHKASGTLLITDLAFNLHHADWSILGIYIRLSGVFKQFGLTRFLKLLIKDKARAREIVDTILQWKFDSIIMAHGDVIQNDGKRIFKNAFKWLKK